MKSLGLLLLLASAAFGQAQDGITTSITRSMTLPGDETLFTVALATGLDATQDQALQPLRDAGTPTLTILTNSVGQSQNNTYPPSTTPPESIIYYLVSFTVPSANLKDLAKKLDAIRNKLPAVLRDLQYNAALNASQALVDTTRRNLLPQMLLDAKVKAAALAEAASLKLGAIQGVTESSYGSGYISSPFFGYSAVLSATNYSASGSGTQYSFTVAVKFGVQ
jgi:hypothetical protein